MKAFAWPCMTSSHEQHVCARAPVLSGTISGLCISPRYTGSVFWGSDSAQLTPATWRHHGLISDQPVSQPDQNSQDARLAITPNCYHLPPFPPPSAQHITHPGILIGIKCNTHTCVNQMPFEWESTQFRGDTFIDGLSLFLFPSSALFLF